MMNQKKEKYIMKNRIKKRAKKTVQLKMKAVN